MPRKRRVEYSGAVYHGMSRGDYPEAIYRDNPERERFLACLAERCEKTAWRVHAFARIGNPYPLLEGLPADSVGGEAVRAWGEADGERWVRSAVEGLGLAEESLER